MSSHVSVVGEWMFPRSDAECSPGDLSASKIGVFYTPNNLHRDHAPVPMQAELSLLIADHLSIELSEHARGVWLPDPNMQINPRH